MAATPSSNSRGDSASEPVRDKYPCKVCQKHCSTGIKCSNCSMWIHYQCSDVATYILVIFKKSSRKFTCLDCTKETYPNYADLAAEIEDHKSEEIAVIQGTRVQSKPVEISVPQATLDTETPINGRPNSSQTKTLHLIDHKSTSTVDNPETTETISKDDHQEVSKRENSRDLENLGNKPNHKKLVVCKFYLRNACRYGASGKKCMKSHPKICSKFMKNGKDDRIGCNLGWKCTDYHPFVCRSSLHKRVCEHRDCKHLHIKGTKTPGTFNNYGSAQNSKQETAMVPDYFTGPRDHTKPKQHESSARQHNPQQAWPTLQQARDRSTVPDQATTHDHSSFLEVLMQRLLEVEKQSQTIMGRLLAQTELEAKPRGRCSCH
ncbi:hypothetical protein Pmani_007143 [Petrolisthes manimaculis]|uniref:C3H1-type domain-containing protein n=1 Tax=Petrolisthes manimaculis TaxID=1843537 RepID=A0AAE1Q9K5_9EUCA|nr:hypothetical protein Pmani_007143 [Petrolisthes manimaculis]